MNGDERMASQINNSSYNNESYLAQGTSLKTPTSFILCLYSAGQGRDLTS